MKRRHFLKLAPAAFLPLLACHREPSTGPATIKWDRDTCVRCSMVISDRRFAAQARDNTRKVLKFDDIGCAVFYLEHSMSGTLELWVAAQQDGRWLDARQAWYMPGKRSPMGYGYAAAADPLPGALAYEETRKRILALGK